MGHNHAREVARRLITGGILLAVIVTTFLPGWDIQAATTPVLADDTNSNEAYTGEGVDRPLNTADQRELAPMNALILSEPGSADTLQRAVIEAGGYIYIRQGDALFVGLDRLNYQELAPIGARAVYQGVVPEHDLAALPESDRGAAETWNQLQNPEQAVSSDLTLNSSADQDLMLIPKTEIPAISASASTAPTDIDTSVFMVGSVAVEVVFVESATHKEDWTQDEINKVKGEVASALEWWTVAPTAPDSLGNLRPPAHLTWTVNYHSPFEDNKVQVSDVEPITKSIGEAMDTWIPLIASRYNGGVTGETAARTWADRARDTAQTDWGFILYVVDSSSDIGSSGGDGKFNDDLKIAGALNTGPWAVVSSMGMDGGLSNLEIIIAKMIGHIFGAGDETYDDIYGCHPDEYYGYLHIKHDNCKENNPAQSLMRSGYAMISAYQNYQLSQEARWQVGWRDNDENGVYDVMDNLSDNLSSLPDRFVCPYIHLANITLDNLPAVPLDYADHGDEIGGWHSQIYNPSLATINNGPYYHTTNINWAGYVWGRINGGDWIGATPHGAAWDKTNTGYSLVLPGASNTNNNDIDIAIMNRWEQRVYSDQQTDLPIANAWSSLDRVENDDELAVEYFDTNGSTEANWVTAGGVTYTETIGAEVCFSFAGTEVTVSHSQLTNGGKANVFVDGVLHSTIDYKNDDVNHVIGSLTDDNHIVQLVVSGPGMVDFDAFQITDSSVGQVIYGKADPPNEIDTDAAGFYEHGGAKIQYIGEWATVDLGTLKRQGTPDNQGKSSNRPLDRIYAYFKKADTVAIYRKVYSGGGSADVYLNGEYQGTMQNHATKAMLTPYYISGLSPDVTYSLEIRINNTGDNQFIFDGLRLLNLADSANVYRVVPPSGEDMPAPLNVKANGGQENVGSWISKSGYIQSSVQGDVTNVYFQGSAISIRRDINTTYRQMEVYVDGVLKLILNNTGAAATAVSTTIHGLNPYFSHVLQIRLTYTNPTKPALNIIRGFTVHYFEAVEAGAYEEYEYNSSGNTVRTDFVYENTWSAPKVGPGPFGRHFVETKNRQASAFLYFTGVDTISVYGVVGTVYGAADIYVNGELKGRFTQKSSITGYQRFATITGFVKQYTDINVLEIRVNTSVANLPRVISLDRVVLYKKPVLQAGIYDNDEMIIPEGSTDTVPALQFSGQWKRTLNSAAHDGSMDVVQSREDVLVFSVLHAASVTVYRKLASGYGMADVYVDGRLYTSFNNYSSVTNGVYRQPFEIVGLEPDFQHEIKIQPRRTGSKFTKFDIDYIAVGGSALPGHLTTGKYQQNDPVKTADGAIEYIGKWVTSNTAWYTSPQAGARVMVTFQGNAFSTYYRRKPDGGIFDVYIDGVRQQRVNTRATTRIADIPVSVSRLVKKMHTAEIVIVSGTVDIDAFEVYGPDANGDYETNLVNPSETLVFSGRWTPSGEYLRAAEVGASVAFFIKNSDTLYIKRQAKPGIFDVYVNGVKRTTAGSYVTKLGKPTETFVVSGLSTAKGTWIELKTQSTAMVSLSHLELDTLIPKRSTDCAFEAEDLPVKGTTGGYWLKRPGTPNETNYHGGYNMVSQSAQSSYYVGIQGIDYLTVYRALSPDWGSANIYIDGVLWGAMSNYAAKLTYKIPFQVGPLPEDNDPHVIEFRQASKQPFGLDYFECRSLGLLGQGYYENDDPDLGASGSKPYLGSWTNKVVTNASGGHVHQTAQRGARLTVRFEGNKLTIYRTTTIDGRQMTATVDGVKYTINNQSSSIKYRVPYTILLTENTIHSLEMEVNSGVVNFDALEVGTAIPGSFGAYQEDSPQVVVNDSVNMWTPTSSVYHSEGAHIITTKKNANVLFLFYGRRVTTYMTRGKNWGKVRILLDGKSIEQIDLYTTGGNKPFFAYDITGLEKENHVLELRFEGKMSINGKARANVDAFSVDGAPVPRPDEILPPSEPDSGGDEGDDDNIPTEGCFEEARQDVWTYEGDWTPDPDGGASGWQNPDTPLEPGGMYTVGVGDPDSLTPGEVYAQFAFRAEGFGLLYHLDEYGGNSKVFIDDMTVHKQTLSMYIEEGSLWIEDAWLPWSGLDPDVVHVLRIEYSGPGDEFELSNNIYIDRIDLPAYDATYNDACLPG